MHMTRKLNNGTATIMCRCVWWNGWNAWFSWTAQCVTLEYWPIKCATNNGTVAYYSSRTIRYQLYHWYLVAFTNCPAFSTRNFWRLAERDFTKAACSGWKSICAQVSGRSTSILRRCIPPYTRLLGRLSDEEEAGVGHHAWIDCLSESKVREPSTIVWLAVGCAGGVTVPGWAASPW